MLSIRFSDNGLIEDSVAGIAVRFSCHAGICLINLRVDCNVKKKSAPKIGCFTSATINVHEYSLFSPTLTIRLLVPYVVIVKLFAATKGRLSASTVPLAQDRGKTLTAAPLSIKYLHLLRLSATYSSLEGDRIQLSRSHVASRSARQTQESLPCAGLTA